MKDFTFPRSGKLQPSAVWTAFLFTDGGSRGNPGPAAAGAIIKDKTGEVLFEKGQFLGQATNNEAEYRALLLGLKASADLKPDQLVVLLDSELVYYQLRGDYRVKNPILAKLWQEAKKIEKNFPKVIYKHIPREKNTHADALVNEALDRVK